MCGGLEISGFRLNLSVVFGLEELKCIISLRSASKETGRVEAGMLPLKVNFATRALVSK